MEINFAGDNLEWIDPNCDVQRARLFIAVLPYSNLTYVEAFPNEKQQSWISGIVHALEYSGGTPQVLVMDNAQALVRHSSWYEGEVQQTVRSLCNYYDIEPWACQPRRSKQKNRVEAGVRLAQRRIIAAMELERTPMARDLDHLNEQVKAKLEELNNAPFTATGRSDSRRQMFEDDEREYLGRLPLQAFCPLDIRALVVDRGHCVRISGDGHRYSTPPEYIGKRVSVTITDDKVYIYDLDSWVKIAEHKRYKNVQGNKTHLLTEHLTDAERKYRRQPREWVAEFVKAGLPEDFADRLVHVGGTLRVRPTPGNNRAIKQILNQRQIPPMPFPVLEVRYVRYVRHHSMQRFICLKLAIEQVLRERLLGSLSGMGLCFARFPNSGRQTMEAHHSLQRCLANADSEPSL